MGHLYWNLNCCIGVIVSVPSSVVRRSGGRRGRLCVRTPCRGCNIGWRRRCCPPGICFPTGHPILWSRSVCPGDRIRGIPGRPGTVDPILFYNPDRRCRKGRFANGAWADLRLTASVSPPKFCVMLPPVAAVFKWLNCPVYWHRIHVIFQLFHALFFFV